MSSKSQRTEYVQKHRTLLIALLIVLGGMLVGMIACCATFIEYYATGEASVQINGYRIDFVYHFAMDRKFVTLSEDYTT